MKDEATKNLVFAVKDLRHQQNKLEGINKVISALSWFLDVVLEESNASLLLKETSLDIQKSVEKGKQLSKIMDEYGVIELDELRDMLDQSE